MRAGFRQKWILSAVFAIVMMVANSFFPIGFCHSVCWQQDEVQQQTERQQSERQQDVGADQESEAGSDDAGDELQREFEVLQAFARSSGVSTEVREIFERGLHFLSVNQKEDGTWTGELKVGGEKGVDPQAGGATNGETALCLMSFLACGEDPNFGRYQIQVRKCVRALLLAQNPTSGFIGKNMYEHGFAMLALSEAYGVVDETTIWRADDPGPPTRPTIGHSLELAIGCAMLGQKSNPANAWTYSPENKSNHEGTRADTSVAGAVLMGLLGARNAGIPVPDKPIDDALNYYRLMTKEGKTIYSSEMQWATPETRSAIAALVMKIGKRTQWEEFKPIRGYLAGNLEFEDEQHPYYSRYYMAQALFQIDPLAWQKWHAALIPHIKNLQQDDGKIAAAGPIGFTGQYQTPAYTTSMSLLALALEYRLLPIYER